MSSPAESLTASDGLSEQFSQAYGRTPTVRWSAPARVNLIGEHTDYNNGFALPLAIQRRVVVAAAAATGPMSAARSIQEASTSQFVAATVEPGDAAGWSAYVAGVAWALREVGHAIPEVDLLIDSDIPVGAGLSSSAALGCAVASALADLAGLHVDGTELALLVSRAENDFVGAPTGVMDQMASIHGLAGHAIFLDTRSLAFEPVPFSPPDHDLSLLIIDTKVAHQLVDSEYAQRRRSCHEAACLLGVATLRDIQDEPLERTLAQLPDDTMRRRVRHVVTENARVLDAVELLTSGQDPRDIGPLMTSSHRSLRDDFEVTVAELEVAVDAALAAGAYGARMTGGGFGGCAIALVDRERDSTVRIGVRDAFRSCGFGAPGLFVGESSAGATRL